MLCKKNLVINLTDQPVLTLNLHRESKNSFFAAINVQPDPVKLVQLNNGSYWDWMSLGYNPPEGCAILNYTADPSQGGIV